MSEFDRIENVTPAVRLRKIQELLSQRGSLTLKEAVAEIPVSEMTLRRDFVELERMGVVDRTWGGVVERRALVAEIGHNERENTESAAKHLIASLTADLINDGETVFLSGGTTALAVAQQLARRSDLTIITTSIPALLVLVDNPKLVVIAVGGRTSPYNNDTTGPQAQSAIETYRADKAVIGTTGITADGVFNANLERSAIDRLMVQNANSALVCADHTKIGRTALTLVAPISPTLTLVTDMPLPRHLRDRFRSESASVVTPDARTQKGQHQKRATSATKSRDVVALTSHPSQVAFKKEKTS